MLYIIVKTSWFWCGVTNIKALVWYIALICKIMAALGFNVNVKGIFPNCVKFLSTVLKTPDGFATLTGKHMNETAFSLIAKFQEGRGMKVNAYE